MLTVGGRPQPLKTAIRELRPDRCIFICSEETRTACNEIIADAGMDEAQTEVHVISNVDDLGEVFATCAAVIRDEQRAGRRVMADYTGGTKSMSSGLAFAATALAVELYVTTGVRRDTDHVAHGESTAPVPRGRLGSEMIWLFDLPDRLGRFAFREAESVIRQAQRRFGHQPSLAVALELVSGFDAWDRFDHESARKYFEHYKEHLATAWETLRKTDHERRWLEQFFEEKNAPLPAPYGYLVADLIRNAERRAVVGRYDDAVGRYYRALELWAQLRLAVEHRVASARVDPQFLHENAPELCDPNSDEPVKVGLMNSWRLLAALDDPIGVTFRQQEDALRSALTIRNNSLFAHGFTPISESDWQGVHATLGGFLRESLKATGFDLDVLFPQFPTEISWYEAAAGRR